MDPISEMILAVAKTLGLSPVATAMLIPLVIIVCKMVTRLIPDTAAGPLKYVRMVTKFVGLYVKDNSGVGAIMTTQGTVVRQADPTLIPESVQQVLDLDEPINTFKSANAAINRKNESV